MKVHANAALSFRQRERMVRGIIEQGVAADAGRRGGRSQRAHLLEVGGPLARAIRRQLAQSRVAMMPGPASRRLVVVRLSSERACQAVGQDRSFARRQESPVAVGSAGGAEAAWTSPGSVDTVSTKTGELQHG